MFEVSVAATQLIRVSTVDFVSCLQKEYIHPASNDNPLGENTTAHSVKSIEPNDNVPHSSLHT